MKYSAERISKTTLSGNERGRTMTLNVLGSFTTTFFTMPRGGAEYSTRSQSRSPKSTSAPGSSIGKQRPGGNTSWALSRRPELGLLDFSEVKCFILQRADTGAVRKKESMNLRNKDE